MGVKRITGLAAIDSMIAAFQKNNSDVQFGLGNIIESSECFESGSITLDSELGCGGIPVDRIIEVYGPPSGGKSSLCLQFLKQWQKYENQKAQEEKRAKRIAALIDLERTNDTKFIQGFEVNTEEVLYIRPNTAEQALQIAINLGNSSEIGCVVFDSVDAAQTEEEVNKDMNESSMATLPRKMSKAMRETSKIAKDHKVLYLFINQERESMSMYSGPKTSGGHALPYYASLRLKVTSKISSKKDKALEMKIAIKKNKLAMQGGEAEVEFIVGRGIDPYADLVQCAKNKGIIRFAGQAVKVKGSEDTLCIGGRAGLIALLKSNTELFDKIKTKCMEVTNDSQNTEISEED